MQTCTQTLKILEKTSEKFCQNRGKSIYRTNHFTVRRFDVGTTAVTAVVRTATVVVFVVAVAVALVLRDPALARASSRCGLLVIWILARALCVVGLVVDAGGLPVQA